MFRVRNLSSVFVTFFVVSVVSIVLAGHAREAGANGRYPSANDVVIGPGAASDVLVVRTTFGLLTSEDRGRSWRWICEDALDRAGVWDAAVVLAADGNLVLGVPSGIRRTSGRCDITTPAGAPTCFVPDLAADPAGERVVAAVSCVGAPNGVATSSDRGKSFTDGAAIGSFFVETVEVAASDPKRLYLSGYVGGGPRLFRSDDAGVSFAEVTREFLGGNTVFVSAVDAKNADVVYVRSDLGVGTMLLKSIDGGAHFSKLGETKAKMVGFALSDDGRTVWMGSADRAEGILRSVDGGPFTRVLANITVGCMRYHAGALYVCGDDFIDGFALACSGDGGDHLHPIFSLRNVLGPEECPSGSLVGDVCAPLWPALAATLSPPDAGPAPATAPCEDLADAGDAGVDADAGDAPMPDVASVDTSTSDADVPRDSSIPPVEPESVRTVEGSGCELHGAPSARTSLFSGYFVAALAMLSMRRSRAR